MGLHKTKSVTPEWFFLFLLKIAALKARSVNFLGCFVCFAFVSKERLGGKEWLQHRKLLVAIQCKCICTAKTDTLYGGGIPEGLDLSIY